MGVKVRLMAGLKEAAGREEIEVDADTWRDALRLARERVRVLKEVLGEDGTPRPGYIVFVDGVDVRLLRGDEASREIVILPVNHGGSGGGVVLQYVSWEEIEKSVKTVCRKIVESGFEPEVVVGILRGGVVPARLIADELGIDDIGIIEIKLYTKIGARKPRPYVRQPLILDVYGKRVLIVDDVSDTGLTLQLAMDALRLYLPEEVKTATLYVKPWTKLYPDYYSDVVDKWIVFPWEKREVEKELKSHEQG